MRCPKVFRREIPGIFGIEGHGHIQAVQPHLVRVNLFVPETAFRIAGLVQQLPVQLFNRLEIFIFRGDTHQLEQGPSGTDMVQGIIGLLIPAANGTGRVDKGIVPVFHIRKRVLEALLIRAIQKGLQLQASGIIPFQSSLLAVQIGGRRTALQFRLHRPHQKTFFPVGTSRQQAAGYDRESFHRLSKGFQTIPSCAWYITFSKEYFSRSFARRVWAHFTRAPRAPGPLLPYSA